MTNLTTEMKVKNLMVMTRKNITINIPQSEYDEMVVGNNGEYDVVENEGTKYCVIDKVETYTDCFGTVYDEPGWDLICQEVI
mgnify:CR=1 FL=1